MTHDLSSSIGPDIHPERPDSLRVTRLLMAGVVIAGLSFLAGVLFANSTRSRHDNDEFNLFWQSWDILDSEYFYDLPAEKDLTYGAIQGLLTSVGDRYTFFVPPRQADYDRQKTAGEFGGIGADVSPNPDGELVIVEPHPGMPAEEAGLSAGDVITSVDGTPLKGLAFDAAVGLLRGDIGSKVALTIYRPTDDREFSVEITRTKVELEIVSGKMLDNVAYVRLLTFTGTATISLKNELSRLLEQDPKGVILDLRGNPGGLLDQAISISDLFLGDGVVLTQRNRQGDEIIYRSENGDLAENVPVAVLIDGGSASASEVVAGALSDRGRAVLIGQTSYGKGVVQYVHDMPDGSQLHITVAAWFTPNNTPIQGEGLTPDIAVTIPDNLEPGQDPFIDAALRYFNEPAGESAN